MDDHRIKQKEYDEFVASVEREYELMWVAEQGQWSDRNDQDAAYAQLNYWRGEQLAWANCHYFGMECDDV